MKARLLRAPHNRPSVVLIAAAVVALLCSGPSVGAAGPFALSLAAPTTLASPPGPVIDASGVALSDGRTLVAYWHAEPSGLALSATVVESSGTVVLPPTDLAASTGGLFQTSLGEDGAGHAAVLWVDGARAFLSYFDGSSLSAPAALDFAGLNVGRCLVAGSNGSFLVGCDSTDPLVPGDLVQIRLGRFAPGASAPGAPLIQVAPGGQEKFIHAVSLDSAGRAWVAFASATPSAPGRRDLLLTALDTTGTAVLGPSVLLAATNESLLAQLVSPDASPDSAYVAYTEVDNLDGFVQVAVRQFSAATAGVPPPALFSSAPAIVTGLSLSARTVEGESMFLVGWSEDRPSDRDPLNGTAHPRPLAAVLNETLSISVPLQIYPPRPGEFTSWVGNAGDLLEFGPALLLSRVTISTPPIASKAASAPPADPAVVALLAITIGASGLAALSSLSERLRWALLLAVWPLYVALRRDKVLLDNMRRGAIVQVVTEKPGIRFTDLSRRTGIASGVLRHHVAVLEEFGFVSRSASRNAVRIYPAGKNPIREAPFREIREQIIAEIRKAPGLSHAELSRRVGVKWTTVLYHAEILEETGAISTKREGRTRRYWAAEQP